MRDFSTTTETCTKMRRATPTVSGMQRARMSHRDPVLLFSCLTGAKVERESSLLRKRNASPVPENHVQITGEEQAKYQADYQAKIQADNRRLYREKPRNRWNFSGCARAVFFLSAKIPFERREKFFGLRLLSLCWVACQPKDDVRAFTSPPSPRLPPARGALRRTGRRASCFAWAKSCEACACHLRRPSLSPTSDRWSSG